MSREEIQKKKVEQYESLENSFCHELGISKVIRRLSKWSISNPLAKMYFYALKAELCSVLAKRELNINGNKKKGIDLYIGKNAALTNLIDFLYIRNFPGYEGDSYGKVCYGWSKDEQGAFVVFFNLPGCEQISYHNNFKKDYIRLKIPVYLPKWDHQQLTTLTKLEDAICRNFHEELGIPLEELSGKQLREVFSKLSVKSFKNINEMYDGVDNMIESAKKKLQYLEEDFCGIGSSTVRSILAGVGDSNNDTIAYLLARILNYEEVRLENDIETAGTICKKLSDAMMKCSVQVPLLLERIFSYSGENPVSQLFISQDNNMVKASWKNVVFVDEEPLVFLSRRERILKKYSGGIAVRRKVPDASVDNNVDVLERLILKRYSDKIEKVMDTIERLKTNK